VVYPRCLSTIKKFDEALVEVKRALELAPLSLIINRIYADFLMDARRYDDAIEQYRKTLDLDPNFPTTHFFLGRAYEAKGMYDEAVHEYSESAKYGLLGSDAIAKLRDLSEVGLEGVCSSEHTHS
jgi:tetratricopeptide (TPR) repeat protein